MESLLPPDPYKALGLPRDADIATIKKTYKKLALSCHPDKVTDESLKQQKQEEFHKINQAYELLSNEASRQRYDDEYKLEQLRKEKLSRGGAKVADPTMRSARYEVRTQAPAGATFSAPTAHRYEEHKPSRAYDDRYYEERPRKPDSYDPYAKPSSSSRSSREKEIPIKITRVYPDRTRSDHKKKEERRDRERRYESAEDESDEKARYEAGYRRRSEEADARTKAESARRKADEQRRSYDDKSDRRSYEEKVDRTRKLSDLENNAVRYIHRTKAEAERPSPGRSGSSRDVRPEYYESRSRRERADAPRRSSARPKEHTSSSGRDRDRKGIEIVDWEGDLKMPSFKHSSSSPADLHVPPHVPQRSYTESSRDHRRKEPSPTPKFRRSETMPTVSHSARRPEVTVPPSSGLRESVAARDSGASSPETYPTIPPPSSSKTKYYYQTPNGGVRLTEDSGVANGHRTVLHEPARHRTRSPSPLSRPPMGANRPVDPSTTYSTNVPKVTPIPPLGRIPTVHVEPERGRRPYGDVSSDKLKRENARRQTSFSPDKVSYSQRIGPDDIRWSAARAQSSRMDQDRDYVKPGLSRHATSVY